MPIDLVERPRARRLPTITEMDACDVYTEKAGDCSGCPQLRHATDFDVYCATGYVWPMDTD